MPASEVRRLRDDPAGYDLKYWAAGAELGWTSMLVSEERGGGTVGGGPLTDLSLIAYQFGAYAAPGPLVPVNVVAFALDRFGVPAHTDVLDELMVGATVAAWCFTEPSTGDGVERIGLEISVDGDDLVLNGEKRPVEAAGQAEQLLVTGRTGAGLSQVLVPVTAPGVSVRPMQTIDVTRRYGVVRFDDVRIPAACAVGELGGADDQVERQLRAAIVLHSAESVGAMRAAFEMTRRWADDRYSFGRPLSSYQEIKHRFADMLAWLEASEAITDAACAAVDVDSPEADQLVSAAKAYVGEFGVEMLQDCVQLHGGIGLTYEHDLHLFVRRASVNRPLYGAPDFHRQRLGRLTATAKEES
jgi:alkylation response protein AidB-like acyl-CoA dehydrogenase